MTLQKPDPAISPRQSEILERVGRHGYVTIESLAAEFGVSTQTVRRDIIALSEGGRVQRFHGGAGPVDTAEAARLDYGAKREIGTPEKTVIGRRAAGLIPDGAAIFLDVGTTVEACARELARRDGLIVFTNSMRSAMVLDSGRHEVHVLGGRLAGRDGSLVGEAATDRLRTVNLDVALIACSAIDEGGRVMDFDLTKIAVKLAAMAAAQQSMLLATRSKFNRVASCPISTIDAFDFVITEECAQTLGRSS